MADQQQESPVLFHLNSEIYKNGLKFDRDRTFRNRLIVKTIILMAVLLIVATVSCVSMARSQASLQSDVGVTTDEKGTVRYGQMASEPVTDGGMFSDLQTTFVPPPIAHRLSTQRPTTQLLQNKTGRARKRRNLNANEGIRVEIPAGCSPVKEKGTATDAGENSDFFQKPPKEGVAEDVKLNVKEGAGGKDQVHQLKPGGEIDERLERVKEVSRFWKDGSDLESVRSTQAKRMLSYMDLTVDPCDDFYQYACGNWEKNNPIPQDKAGYDIFELLRESLEMVLRDLLTEPSSNETSLAVRKAREYYESCMNEDTLEKRGNEPLLRMVAEMRGWPMMEKSWNSSNFNWVELIAKLKVYGIDVFVTQWIGHDLKNSSEYVIQLDQTRLGLPSRDYFLKEANAVYLEAYKNYLIKVAVLLGVEQDSAAADAEEMIQFEKELAKITAGPEERRNLSELYVKLRVSELRKEIPQVDWARYLSIVLGRTVDPSEYVVAYSLKYYRALVPLVEKTEKRIVCNYLMWRFVRKTVNNLDKKFQDARQEYFYALFGREKAPTRWAFCVAQVNANMGMALGSIFVQRFFDETSKNDTLNMTQDILHSFRDMLNATEWMDERTKQLSLQKIDAMILRIGYPDFLQDRKELDSRYGNVNITKSLFFENTINILLHATKLEQEKLGKVMNRSLWYTPPTIVNAYYSRNINQIMVPAGILQPPFYHKHFPKCLNYGGIGVAIGHEMTHGFDDKGRLYDQNGNYLKWWNEETIENFHARAHCLVEQYSSYTVREVDMHIDGISTQGENIADNGGIRQAFRAYERWLLQNDSVNETLPGINATNFQLFFLNFAQIWCGGMRPEASRNKMKTAQHSPGKFRVIGTLSNSEEFARVFRCPTNATMNRSNKCSLW